MHKFNTMKYKITATSVFAAIIFLGIYNVVLKRKPNPYAQSDNTQPHDIAVFYTPNNVDTITLYTQNPLRIFSSNGTNYVSDNEFNSFNSALYSSSAPIKILN